MILKVDHYELPKGARMMPVQLTRTPKALPLQDEGALLIWTPLALQLELRSDDEPLDNHVVSPGMWLLQDPDALEALATAPDTCIAFVWLEGEPS